MGGALKYPIAIVVAFLVTVTLFFVMQTLIAMHGGELQKGKKNRIADITMPERAQEIRSSEEKPEKPDTPEEPPPDIPAQQLDFSAPDASSLNMSAQVNNKVDLGGPGLGVSDGEYLPIVKVPAVYPPRALSRGIEGYVIVEFTVTREGKTKDAFVVEAFTTAGKPTTIFNKSAVKAALKFKYKPKVIDGNPVEVAGVQNKITYKIDN